MIALPFKRNQEGCGPAYALFGKLPHRPDFVSLQMGHPAVREFDGLIQEAMQTLAREPGWERAYDRAPFVDFYYASRDGAWVFVGVLAPSRDQAGRRYPLVGGALLPAEAVEGTAHLAPLAYEVFYAGLREQMATALENAVEALACRQFLESHLHAGNGAADLHLAQSVASRYFADARASRLGGLLGERGQGRLLLALLNLVFYHAFLRRFDHAASDQMIVLPLSREKGEDALVASAWLALLSALWVGGGSAAWAGSYWRGGNDPPVLASFFGRMPKAYPKSILTGTLRPPDALDLGCEQPAWRTHPLYAETAYALERLLADPELTIADLASFLRDVSMTLRG